MYFIVIFPCLPLVQGKPSFSLAKKLSNSTSPAYAWRTVFFSWPRILTFRLTDLSLANRLFSWPRISSLQIIRLIRGELSFSLAKNIIVPNYPTYAWRTVFFPCKKIFQLDFSGLCVANCLFFLAKNLIAPNYPIYPWRTVFSYRNDPCDYRE